MFSFPLKIRALDPSEVFLGMSSFRPLPEHFPNAKIRIGEDSFADDEAIVISPASDDRVELFDQKGGRSRTVCFHDVFDILQEFLNLYFRRFDEQLSFVLSYIETEEIKTVVDV